MEASPPVRIEAWTTWTVDPKDAPEPRVHEPEDEEPVDTGLVDHLGRAIKRLPEPRRPVGFLHAY